MSRTSTVRALSLVAGLAGLVLAGSAMSQPSSRSPLAPPANGPRKSEPGDGYVALTNATVHVKPGVTIERATVVIRGGKVESVTTEGTTGGEPPVPPPTIPAGAEARDCTGMHIYAGFIEPYFEVEVPKPDPGAPGSHWNTHVMPQRSALDKGAAGISAKDAEALRSMGFVAAAISPKGGIFRGSSALVSLAAISGDPSDAPPRVYAERVYQCVSLDTSRDDDERPARGMRPTEDGRWSSYPNSQMGSIALVRQTLSDAQWQQDRRATAGGDASASLDALRMYQLAAGSDGAVPHDPGMLLLDADDELEALREAKIAAEFKRSAVILGSGLEFRRLEAIAKTKLPFVLPLTSPKTPKVGSVGEADAVELKELITWEQAPTNPRRLDAAGVMVALTTSKVPEKAGGRKSFKEHLGTAIKHGLKPDRALAMLTTNAAQILGVSDQFGTVEKGKAASLIVADGELFTDKPDAPKKGEPGYVRAGRIVDVWVDGRRHVVAPKQRRDLGGTWEITLTPGPRAGSNVRITFEIDDDFPPAITIVKRTTDEAGKEQKATTKCQGVSIDEGGAIRFTFDHEPLGEKGVFVSSGMIEKGADGQPVMRGESIRSSGEMLRWSAVRVSTEIPKKEGRKKGEGEEDGKTGEGGADDQHRDREPGLATPRAGEQPVPPGDGDSKKMKAKKSRTAEADAIAAIPEQLGLPVGPYSQLNVPFQKTCIIKNATIWTCGPKGVIENGAILINDGKIVIVGSADDIAKWPDMPRAVSQQPWTIDAQGKHVTPGIIDCHSHTGISKGVNESGQAVTAEVRIGDVTDPDSISWYRQLAAGVTTVNSLHGSANPIGGQNQVNKNRWGCISPDDMHFAGAIPGIKFALGENVKQSNGDRQSTRYPVTRMGVETLMRDRFTAAKEYLEASRQRGNEAASGRRDLELEALGEILEGKRLIHCHSYRQDEILMLCRIADEFGFKIGTFQHGLEVYKVAEIVKEHVGPGGGASLFADWWAYKVEVQDAIPYAGPMQTEVGVLTSYNSDSDEMARRMNVEAGKAAKYSHGRISPEEALKFVTINPARQLRIDDKVGSLEPGKDADIAIWSGPPLSSMSRCERTFVDGREMFSLEKDAELRKQNRAERARLIQKILALKGDKGGGKKDEDDKPGPDAGKPTDEELASSDRRSILMQAYSQADDLRREQFLELLRRGLDPRFHCAGDCGCFGN